MWILILAAVLALIAVTVVDLLVTARLRNEATAFYQQISDSEYDMGQKLDEHLHPHITLQSAPGKAHKPLWMQDPEILKN